MMDTFDLLNKLGQSDLTRSPRTRHDPNFSVAAMPKSYIATGIDRMTGEAEASEFETGSLFVVARGATGKSAFAQYASAKLNAPLWRTDTDLAVGGAALDSKLSRFVHEVEIEEVITTFSNPLIVVDALDEAEVRVSAQSWNEFKDSLVKYACLGVRFIVCGRALATHDVKSRFEQECIQSGAWELRPFNSSQQRDFIDASYLSKSGFTSVDSSAYRDARDSMLANLSFPDAGRDRDNFAGYAPVLQAVAAQLSEEANLASRSSREKFSNIEQVIGSLTSIVDEIFKREQKKFGQAIREKFHEAISGDLFNREEQARLLLHRAGLLDSPLVPDSVDESMKDDYLEFREAQIKDHPFLSGSDEFAWSSSVFEGFCLAFLEREIRSRREFFKAASKNPFFGVFVSKLDSRDTDAWGLSAVHSSLLEFGSSTAPEGEQSNRTVSGKITFDGGSYEYSGSLTDRDGGTAPIELVEALKVRDSESGFLTYHGDLQNLEIDAPGGYVVVEPEDRAAYLGPSLVINAEVVEIAAREVKLPATPAHDDDLFVGIASEFVSPLPKVVPRPVEGMEAISLIPKLELDLANLDKHIEIHPYPWGTFVRRFYLPLGEELREQADAFTYRVYKLIEALRVLSTRFNASGMTVAGFSAKAGLPRIRPESAEVLSILEDEGIIRTTGEVIHYDHNSGYVLFSTPLTRPRNSAAGFQDLPPDQRDEWKKIILKVSMALSKRIQK